MHSFAESKRMHLYLIAFIRVIRAIRGKKIAAPAAICIKCI
jgi:hypothetical protein